MNSEQAVQNKTSFGPLQIGILIATLITATVHLTLLFPDPLFILNSLGYLGLLGAYFLPIPFTQENHSLVRWAYMGFAVATILAWIAMGDKTWIVGYLTKADEIILLVLLWMDRRS
jgi:hypothetical protein